MLCAASSRIILLSFDTKMGLFSWLFPAAAPDLDEIPTKTACYHIVRAIPTRISEWEYSMAGDRTIGRLLDLSLLPPCN